MAHGARLFEMNEMFVRNMAMQAAKASLKDAWRGRDGRGAGVDDERAFRVWSQAPGQ